LIAPLGCVSDSSLRGLVLKCEQKEVVSHSLEVKMFWQFRKSLIRQSFILVKEMDESSIPHSLNFSTVTALNHFCLALFT